MPTIVHGQVDAWDEALGQYVPRYVGSLPPGPGGSSFLVASNNLSDVASAAAARTNLGLGSAALQPSAAFVSATSAQSAGTVLAGPASGSAAAPTFRALTASDIPALNYEPAFAAGTAAQYRRGDKTWQALDTAAVAEHAANLYFTNARADARITLQKGAANGLATLGADSKIPTSQLPALAITDTFVVASQAAMLALSAETGDVAVRTDLNRSYILAGTNPATLSHWQELLTPTDAVLSVNGQTGAVVLTTSHISEGTNFYWTQSRFDTAFAAKTTNNLAEGASNLYFTNARARSALSGTNNQVNYNNATGVFSTPQDIHTGASPTFAALTTTGNIFVNAATANLLLKDGSTGFQAAATQVVTLQASNSFRSTSFTSGLVGFAINAAGSAEFADLTVRGAIRSSVLLYNAVLATNGSQVTVKAAAKLRTDLAVPSGPTYGTTAVNIDVVDQDGLTHAASQLFVAGDYLYIKDGITGGTIFKVSSVSDQTSFWRYVCTIEAGTNNVTYRAGVGVLDYGASGGAGIVLTADQGNAPYLQMFTHAGVTAQNSGGTFSLTPLLRLGNLNGTFDYATNVYGLGTGTYATGKAWLTAATDPASTARSGVRLGVGTTTFIHLKNDGSGYLANSSISWDTSGALTVTANATIAGWSVTANLLSSGSGVSTVGLSSGGSVAIYAGHATPGSAPFRVTAAGALTATSATITGAITASSGSFTGTVQISSASGALAVGTTPPTSAAAGTGLWFDRTGLYGLASDVVQAKFDAATGVLTAGAGIVTLDSGGMWIDSVNGTSDARSIRWKASSDITGAIGNVYATGGGVTSTTEVSAGIKSGDTAGVASLQLKAINNLGVGPFMTFTSNGATTLPSTCKVELAAAFATFQGFIVNGSGTPNATLDVRGTGVFTGALTLSGGVSGSVNFDAGTLYVDATTDRVGVGTTAPGSVLTINKASAAVSVSYLSCTDSSADFSHGITDWAPTKAWFNVTKVSQLGGGAVFQGFCDAGDETPLVFEGYFGVTDPNDAQPGMIFRSWKRSGTGRANLGAAETAMVFANGANTYLTLNGAGSLRFHAYGAGTLTTDASGYVTASSDETLKDVKGKFTAGLEAVRRLEPITFGWKHEAREKDDKGKAKVGDRYTYHGWSAQNVRDAIPGAVGQNADGTLTVQDRAIAAALVNSVKDLDLSVEDLRARVAQLERQVVQLGGRP